MSETHSFHIPVMGVGFTIDTPLKVSRYGIDSVMSIGDDILMEKLRKMYCERYHLEYQEISDKMDDFRAKRITAYLNLIHQLSQDAFVEFKNAIVEKRQETKDYFSMLPDNSRLKIELFKLNSTTNNPEERKQWVEDNLSMGSLDVNIMTKVDKENYKDGELLPIEYNDAHASLRGFANSELRSSLILSAGMNPRLFGSIENYKDFYPNAKGEFKKKLVLKVSDYRSALIQGKLLAKKGLWVSEFRIESGLNCGGHAFATDGFLLGPILEEFKKSKQDLIDELTDIYVNALQEKGILAPKGTLDIKISAQGGVGTAEEHKFLIDYYEVYSVGWGTPFLLVPEVVNIDEITLHKLIKAKEKDLYLSHVSPLNIPFNNLRGNSKDLEKSAFKDKGRPGSSCPKKYLALNKEFSDKGICTASRQYQVLKIKELESMELPKEKFELEYEKIVDKSCICVGLGTAALLVNQLDTSVEGSGVSVCPGPNMAYFSQKMTLHEISDHIYGRTHVISRKDRPNMFSKELFIYMDYLMQKFAETGNVINKKEKKYFSKFAHNLNEGVHYYQTLFKEHAELFPENKSNILDELDYSQQLLNEFLEQVDEMAEV
ncbi:MAG: hypothetical protein HUJ25_01485 [Crocinitomicaceae bacterium]|nr:hypothetical protein [Crocinitomicaceae bacterium]